MKVEEITSRVPGIPGSAGDAFDLTAGGVLTASDRKILRYLLKVSFPDVAPGYLAGLGTIGELRAFVESREGQIIDRHERTSYATSSVYMRPVLPGDHEALYFAALEPSNAHRWRFRGRTPAFPEFSQSLGVGSLVEFVFASVDRNALVSYCSAYNYDPVAHHATFAVQRLDYDERFDTAVIESVALLLNYLFATFNLRKVFAEVPEYNLPVFGIVDGVFEVEGARRDFYWHAGRYWEEITISTTCDAWTAFADQFFVGGSNRRDG